MFESISVGKIKRDLNLSQDWYAITCLEDLVVVGIFDVLLPLPLIASGLVTVLTPSLIFLMFQDTVKQCINK